MALSYVHDFTSCRLHHEKSSDFGSVPQSSCEADDNYFNKRNDIHERIKSSDIKE